MMFLINLEDFAKEDGIEELDAKVGSKLGLGLSLDQAKYLIDMGI